MERSLKTRSLALLWTMVLAVAGIGARAAFVQIVHHEEWADRARSQIIREFDIPAERGPVVDRTGAPLAVSAIRYEIGIAPNEIRSTQRSELVDSMVSVLGITAAKARALTDTAEHWHVVPGRFTAEERIRLKQFRGLHFTPLIRRVHPQGEAAIPLVGRVLADGRVLGGVEAAYDTVLAGTPGHRTVYRDVRGHMRSAGSETNREPVPGGSVSLSLDSDLQQVAAEILQEQIDSTRAEGGDVVVLRPSTGDVLALVGRNAKGEATLSPVTAPYEPGSIMKPFAYATLIETGKISFADSVFAENGSAVVDGRRITDVHPYGWLTYLDALAVSSNVALVKTIGLVADTTQYRILDALGFGKAPELGVGRLSSGLLRAPNRWSRFSQGSLAIGYELNATPLHMALAYATFANRGIRMHPRLVTETVSSNGVQTLHEPRQAGRVFSSETAAEMLHALRYVVEEGSGGNADLGPFSVGGKTGTSRAWGDGGYDGHYASFAALFPAENPQVVIIVRIIRPSGSSYYGGSVAAPVVRRILEAMLSSQNPPIDRRELARGQARPASSAPKPLSPRTPTWRELETATTVPFPGTGR